MHVQTGNWQSSERFCAAQGLSKGRKLHLLEKLRALSIALSFGALTLAAGGSAVAQEPEPSVEQTRPAQQAAPAQPLQPAQSVQPAPQAEPAQPATQTGTGQAPDAASPVLQQAEDQLAQADRELKRLIERTNAVEDDDAMLAELRVQVDELSKQIIAASVPTRPRLDEIKARLTELGDPPGEGQPPEDAVITDERKRLLAERGRSML